MTTTPKGRRSDCAGRQAPAVGQVASCDRTRGRRGALGLGALSVLLVLSRLVQGAGIDPLESFPHSPHAEAGLDCLDCHTGAWDAERAPLPAIQTCRGCHEDDAVASALAGPDDETVPRSWQGERRVQAAHFAHRAHGGRGLACADCHGDASAAAPRRPEPETCFTCHAAASGRKQDCTSCHGEDWAARKPTSHDPRWRRRHGEVAQDGETPHPGADCSGCHGASGCVRCHQEERPASHTQFWRIRGHGVAASIDRESCSTCHQSDRCTRCHLETSPMTHRSGWGSRTNRHCLGCHDPVLREPRCGLCHFATPSHASAPRRPLGDGNRHASGANCRACHFPGNELRHVDNGESCEGCHAR